MKFGRIVAALGLVMAIAGCSSDTTTRDATGEIVEEGTVDVFAVQQGDCVNFTDDIDATSSFEGVACDVPHEAQAFALFDIADGEYPGELIVQSQAEDGCVERFEGFMGIAYADSIYFLSTLYPSPDTWEKLDDREVICLVVPGDESSLLSQDLEGVGV